MNQYPSYTPWGSPQDTTEIAEGIVRFSCAGHGGYFVTEARLAEMPEALRAGDAADGGQWFEEDEDWSFVAVAFPQYFETEHVESAKKTLRNWRPEAWEKWSGKTLTLAESHKKREDAFYAEHRDDLLVTTAWGSWHKDVPDGMVGVCAMRGGRRFPTAEPESYWLVAQDEYSNHPAGFIAFVVDPGRHTRMEKAIGA